MALSIASQTTRVGGVVELEALITPTVGNWLVAVVTLKTLEGNSPAICVADYSASLWTLAYSSTTSAFANNTGAQLITQVWVCPAFEYAGHPTLGVYCSAFPVYTASSNSMSMNLFEVAGMGNSFLTVDSVTVATASATTSLAIAAPTPSGGANCLMVACAGTDSGSGTVSVTSAGWNLLTAVSDTNPNALITPIWRETTAGQTASWSSTVSTNWAGVIVAMRTTGIGPTQPNPNWPALEFQLGLGWTVTSPINSVTWTTLPNRLLGFNTQRGYQYELGFVQSSPTDLQLRNDDGALSPRTGGTGTATGNGTTTTLLVSSTDGATMTVTDYFQLKTSGGVLKETTVFQITSLVTSGGTTTVTFTKADGSGGGALASTATGNLYSACPIDLYVPYRILATWNGVRYPVTSGWMERWPQTWRNPHWGEVPGVAIDTIATLTASDVAQVKGEILARKPQSYWMLNDSSGVTSAQNYGTGTTKLVATASSHGTGSAGAAQFGASTQNVDNPGYPPTVGQFTKNTIIGDPGGTGWISTGMTAAESATMGTALVGSPGNNTTFPSVTNGVTVMGITYINQTQYTQISSQTTDPVVFVLRSSTGTGAAATLIALKIGSGATNWGQCAVTVWDQTSHASTTTRVASPQFGNGYWQLWALTFNRTTWKLYIPLTTTSITASGTCNLPASFGLVDFSGEADSTTNGNFLSALHAHLAIFPRQLTADEIQDINIGVYYGTLVYNGTNDTITRALAYGGWRGSRLGTYTTFVNGSTFTSPANTIAERAAILADMEGGRLFSDAAGCLQFRGQEKAALQTSRATIGDRPDLGEITYEGEDALILDFDPTYIYNQVTIQDTSVIASFLPSIAGNTYVVSNTTSIAKYGLRTLGKTVSFNDGGAHALQMANLYLSNYSTPNLRLATVSFSAARRSGSLATLTWPFILNVEVGDLITFNHRPIGAPAISFICVVLNVQHTVAPNQWDTTLTLGVPLN